MTRNIFSIGHVVPKNEDLMRQAFYIFYFIVCSAFRQIKGRRVGQVVRLEVELFFAE